jgi:hypothetical protein
MASAAITFCTAGNRSVEGGTMAVPRMGGATSQILTVTGTSAATTAANPHPGRTGFVSISAIDGALWATAGAAPVAVAGTAGFAVLSGQTRDFAVAHGDKVAVIAL